MKRNSIIFSVDDFLEYIPDLLNSRVEIRIDEANFIEISDFLLQTDKNGIQIHKKKFTRILSVALKGVYNDDLYSKEEVSAKAKNVTAMKFKGKENFRIGCKEIKCKDKTVIMVILFLKKTMSNSKEKNKSMKPSEVMNMNANKQNKFEERLAKMQELLKFNSKEEKLEFDADTIQLNIMHEVQRLMDKEGGMTRKQLADKLGKSKSFVSQIFSCDKKLHLGLLAQFQDIFQAKLITSFKPYSEYRNKINKESFLVKVSTKKENIKYKILNAD